MTEKGRRRPQAPVKRTHEVYDPAVANTEMVDKLRRNGLKRKARSRGLELRHSSYGYALIDAERKRVDDRNDLTLDEVAARLDG